jgi:homoserine O-acetyltransferase
VRSQHRLLTEKLGIFHVISVVGASMGGMQALQWGVSHPDVMDSLVALVPLGRTPAWSTGMSELRRQAIMLDPAWNGGNYTAAPQQGMRLWAGMAAMSVRTPQAVTRQFPNNRDVLPWLAEAEESGWRRMDANDWIYQSWAYDAHDLGTTPGFGGDYFRALGSIKAKTLIMAGTGDLINPEAEALEAAQHIPGARYVRIDPVLPLGHLSAMGVTAPEVERIDSEIRRFLEAVAAH